MKNILFASTALVAFAGAASAEVLISGSAEMGIVDTNDSEFDTQFFQSVDVRFTLTGETDNGLAFGATIDLEDAVDSDDIVDITDGADFTVFISGAFGTLTMGDTDGALDWAVQEVAFGAGSIADDHTAHAGYLGSYLDGSGDGQVLRYDYSVGSFGFAVSAESDADGVGDSDTGFAIGAKYNLDLGGTAVNFGIGYQDAVDGVDGIGGTNFDAEIDAIGVSVDASFANGLVVGIAYTDFDIDDIGGLGIDSGADHIGVGFGYGVGAVSVSANYGIFDFDDGGEAEGYGLAVNYDLGGGAVIQLGYGNSDVDGEDDVDTVSFGLALSF